MKYCRKNKESEFCCILTLIVWVLRNGGRKYTISAISLSGLYSLDSIFSGMVWIDKLHNCVEGICFNVSQGNTKKTFSHFSW